MAWHAQRRLMFEIATDVKRAGYGHVLDRHGSRGPDPRGANWFYSLVLFQCAETGVDLPRNDAHI